MHLIEGIIKRMRVLFVLFFFSGVALCLVLFIGFSKQFDFSMKVSLSSRQKAISEELSYRILDLQRMKLNNEDITLSIEECRILFRRWENSQKAIHTTNELYGLSESNSNEVQNLLQQLTPTYAKAYQAVDSIMTDFAQSDDIKIRAALESLRPYVKSMNDVLGRYLVEQQSSMKSYKVWVAVLVTVMILIASITVFTVRVKMLKGMNESERSIREMKAGIDEAEKVKAEFLANMSHEIRTPLNGVIGMTELLASTRLEDEQRRFVRNIHSSANNLLELLNNLLDVAKMQSGTLELHKEPFNLQDCFDQVIDLLKPAAQQKKLELLSEIQSTLPLEVVQDGTRLKQVLINLVNNAIKFTERGEVLLSVEEVNREGDFILLMFKVSDTGIGISQDEQEKIFQSFYQSDSSARKKYGGSGLGLSISKNYIAGMGGKLWVDSEQGKGSVFAFTIVAEASASTQQAKIAGLSGMKALVVDDNKTNLKILVRQLSAWGIQTTPFNSPELVADMLSNLHKFDFVLMDMQMPEMDGRELTERIRQAYTVAQLPIIVLSSLGENLITDEEGFYNAYLTKPVKQSRLLETICEVMKSEISPGVGAVGGRHVNMSHSRSTIKILVAHDSDLSRAVAAKTLTLLGHNFEIVADTSELLMRSRTERFDLILTDVHSRNVDGVSAARQLTKLMATKGMPIIIGVSDNVEQDRSQCVQAGMSDVMAKPILPEQVEAYIHRWFDI